MPHHPYNDLVLLVLEPSLTIRNLVSRYSHELGITQIDFMDHGEAALQSMSRLQPDIVISALYLDDMSSDVLLTHLRTTPELATTPFILLSSETRFERLDPLRQAGVTAILAKPFTADEFKMAIEHAMQQIHPQSLELHDSLDIADLHVLIVDDSYLARKHTRRLLADMGMEHFSEAENGQDALAHLQAHEFDLIVTDLNMPAMDGEQLVRHLRQDEGRAIPILMITSENDQARLAAVQQAGVSAICDKPFVAEELRRTLLTMLLL